MKTKTEMGSPAPTEPPMPHGGKAGDGAIIDELIREIEGIQMKTKTGGGDLGLSHVKYNLKLLKLAKEKNEMLLRAFEIGMGFKAWDIAEKPKLGEWIELKQKIEKVLEEVGK
jgi:hypothetical protein